MKTFIALIIGLAIGAAAGAGYLYPQLQSAMSKVSLSETSMEGLKAEAAKIKGSLETAAKEAKDKLVQLQSSKQSDEQTIKTLKDQLAVAAAAKESAEKAMAASEIAKDAAVKALDDAKKAAPQAAPQ